ncbi:hypothetical protein [Providencia rettgeri]|uniref:Uncharacterized protein n=1 Tax=Providencia rettgeri TaxID=587 RepID=A0AAW6UPL5_PRORE|nr:hypothetical protein [Providencia rettgeri]
MSSNSTATLTFTFDGNAPSAWISALSRPNPSDSWIDPESPGSVVLREIMTHSSVDTDVAGKTKTLTANIPEQADVLSALLEVYVSADVKILLMAGCEKVDNLICVTSKTTRLMPNGFVISCEQKAERLMYFMTQNGICVLADPTINLSAEKLPGATFFASEQEMDAEGLARWGENGGEGWRTHATMQNGRPVLLNGFGNMIELGDEPEVTINSLSN